MGGTRETSDAGLTGQAYEHKRKTLLEGEAKGEVPLALVRRNRLSLALFFGEEVLATPSEIERGMYHYRREEHWRRDLHSNLSTPPHSKDLLTVSHTYR